MSVRNAPHPRHNFALFVAIGFYAALAFTGGAARADEPFQVLARLAAIGAVLLLIFAPSARDWTILRFGFVALAAMASLIVLQLLPLPVWLWSALPGRQIFLDAAKIAGIEQPWRPIAIVPDLAIDSLLALLFPLAALTTLLKISAKDDQTLLVALVCIVFGSAVLGLGQLTADRPDTLRWFNLTNTGVPIGLFSNRNHQAVFLAIGIPMIATWLGTRAYNMMHMIVSGAAVALLLTVIVLSGSRAGLSIACITVVSSFCLIMSAPLVNVSKRLKFILTSILLLVLAGIIISLRWSLAGTKLSILSFEELRFQVLPILAELAWTYFPVGSGFGSFDTVYRIAEPFKLLGQEYLNHAHNDFLELTIEGGLPALMGILAFLVIWVWRLVAIWKTPIRSNMIMFGRLGTVITLCLLLASLIDYPLRTPILVALFALGCGWMEFAFRSRVART